VAHAFGSGFCRQLQLTRPQRLEILRIEADFVVLFVFEAQNFRRHVLESPQQFAPSLRQQTCIGAGQLDINLARFEACGIGSSGPRGNAVLQSQSSKADEGLEEFCDFLCCCGVVFDRH